MPKKKEEPIKEPVKFHSISAIPTKNGGYIILALDYEGSIWQQESEVNAYHGRRHYPWFKITPPDKLKE